MRQAATAQGSCAVYTAHVPPTPCSRISPVIGLQCSVNLKTLADYQGRSIVVGTVERIDANHLSKLVC